MRRLVLEGDGERDGDSEHLNPSLDLLLRHLRALLISLSFLVLGHFHRRPPERVCSRSLSLPKTKGFDPKSPPPLKLAFYDEGPTIVSHKSQKNLTKR